MALYSLTCSIRDRCWFFFCLWFAPSLREEPFQLRKGDSMGGILGEQPRKKRNSDDNRTGGGTKQTLELATAAEECGKDD